MNKIQDDVLDQILNEYRISSGNPSVMGIDEETKYFPNIAEAMRYAVACLAEQKEQHIESGKNPDETWVHLSGKNDEGKDISYLFKGNMEIAEQKLK
ncbi:MAG TPA: hypothetical protein VI894_01925 [Candidatus Nanoarchaeia archaeon]|nr:hypothetical protein [Candidatus Nanoarchaeia archaeon]